MLLVANDGDVRLTRSAAIGFVPILLIAAVFGTYVSLVTLSTSPSSPTVNSVASGLELRVSLNSTNLRVGQSLNVTVSLLNELPTMNYVSIPSSAEQVLGDFRIQGFPIAVWGGCFFPEPIQFVIVKGNYSLAQLEKLSTNTSEPSIVCMEGGSVRYLAFQANSDVANISGTFCTAGCHPYEMPSVRMSSNFTVNGYWSYPLNKSEAEDLYTPYHDCITPSGNCGITFNYPEVGPIAKTFFSTGLYTLVVADAWGQVKLLNFAVS